MSLAWGLIMRRLQCALLAAAAAIGFASIASAADMPVKARPMPVAVDTLAGDLSGAERSLQELENRDVVIAHAYEEASVVSSVRAGEGHRPLAIHDAGDISGGGSG